MNVGSVGGATSAVTAQAVSRQPEASEVRQVAPDKDRDKDDGASKVDPTPPPVTNASGQLVGQIINTTA
ncbi:hypothetical protein [Zoogloea sp.]|uniref:hypothetical protein n=1 Tax=Zoogloea sp. TaxID=49181 RepID=UPI0035AFF21F